MKNKKFILFGKGYLASNICALNKKKFLSIDNLNQLKKISLNTKTRYIVYYLAIRKSKSLNFNLNVYKNLTKYFHNNSYKIIYFSTTEFNNNNYHKIHKKIEKNIDKKKNLIIRVCQIYGGDISKSNSYGINGFVNKIKNKNYLIINSDFQNRRKYLSIFNLNKTINNKKLLNLNGIVYLASKKSLSYLEILEIIYKYSRYKIKILVKNYERKVKKPKNIFYGNKYKKIFLKENFEKNIKKLL